MRPRKKFSVWLTAIALLVAMVLTPIAAGAKPPASKVWNIYQDKLGAYTVSSAAPKGQTLIEGPFTTQAAATAALTQPPVIEKTLVPSLPDGQNGWYKSNVSLTWNVYVPGSPGASLVVTGGLPQNINADQQAMTYSTSATAVGGSAGPVDVTIKRDATPPEVVFGGVSPAANAAGWNNVVPLDLAWSATDAPSGLAGPAQVTKTVNAEGVQTVSVEFTDNAGNKATDSRTVSVDLTPPVLNLGTSIVDGNSFEVGSVPPEPTFAPTDATSGIDTSSLTGYDVAVGTHTLVATATDLAGNMTQELVGYTVTPHQAQVLAPEALNETFNSPGVANPGSITIPTVAGVDYYIDGVFADGGAHPLFAGNYLVTAAPQSQDYEMVGYPVGGWLLNIAAADVIVEVMPEAPTKVDQQFVSPGVASQGGINIPATTGVDYFIEGAPYSGFVPLDPGIYQVTAQAQQFYALVGQAAWSLEVLAADVTVEVTPEAPSATDQTLNASGFITIPATAGVDYLIDGVGVAAGPNPLAPNDYVVTAAPKFGYAFNQGDVSSWNLTVHAFVPTSVTPAAPSATDATALASGFITIPLSEGVDYALDGTPVADGNHDVAPGPHAVVATAQNGYALLGQTSWNLTVNGYVPPKQIEFVGRTGGDMGGSTLTLPAGWQPGDLAVAFIARNAGGSAPALVAGWTSPAVGGSGFTVNTSPASSYRLMYRTLQAGDTTWTTVGSYRGAAVMVYRNAAFGNAQGFASRSTAAINVIVPSFTLQAPGTSWVGGFAYVEAAIRQLAPVSPFAANRMNGAVPSSSMVGGWDTAGAVASFPNTVVYSAYYAAPATAGFELKLVP